MLFANFLEKNVLASEEVHTTQDNIDISCQCYAQLYNAVQRMLRAKKIKDSLLPRPFFVRKA